MSSIVTLSCPSCNGKLQITQNIDRFACGYCGTEFLVDRGGGIVSLAPVLEGLNRVERGVDRTASELAIARLQKEIAPLVEQRRSTSRQSAVGAMITGVICLFVALQVSGSGVALSIFMFVAILCFLGGYFIWTDTSRQWQALDTKIAAKHEEIKKHQAIIKQ
jgi:hypothetical protein